MITTTMLGLVITCDECHEEEIFFRRLAVMRPAIVANLYQVGWLVYPDMVIHCPKCI